MSGHDTDIPIAARYVHDSDWVCEPSDFAKYGKPWPRFSWLSPRILWASRNNLLAKWFGDPTENARRAWVHENQERLRGAGADPALVDDFTLERPELEDFSFVVMGDPGEGDVGQYATVPAFLKIGEGSEFALIASDVIYPAGDVNEYIPKFFRPYADYPKQIYAVPGNHDWLDGLAGFMRHFCGLAPPTRKMLPSPNARHPGIVMLLHRIFWRRGFALKPGTLEAAEELRPADSSRGPRQPNMYFCIDTPKLRIIGIDLGILGRMDFDQGEWLRRVAAGPKPKILVAGKPTFSGAKLSARQILTVEGSRGEQSDTIMNVMRDPANNCVAMIAGDVHHYERHPAKLKDGRVLQFVISGGGGAFMTCTHDISRVDLPEVKEAEFVLYPPRGDSLRAYSIVLMRKIHRRVPWLRNRTPRGIPAEQAAAIMVERHGLELGGATGGTRGSQPVAISRRSRILSAMVYPRHAWFSTSRISEALDWDDPPFYKNFLKLTVEGDVLSVISYGVSGARRDQDDPIVIDRFEVPLGQHS